MSTRSPCGTYQVRPSYINLISLTDDHTQPHIGDSLSGPETVIRPLIRIPTLHPRTASPDRILQAIKNLRNGETP